MANDTFHNTLTHVPIDHKARPHYTQTQLQTYFSRISLPREHTNSPITSNPSPAKTQAHGLPFIKALMRYHMSNIPFENLELHYSAHKTISLNPKSLYAKFVDRRRGGRCMENNTFFATVLRSLGFNVRNCGGRVSRAMHPGGPAEMKKTYDGWDHMLNLVKLDSQWYVVDVGMGALGPQLPYPLQDGFETVSIAPRRIRLQKRKLPESYASDHEDALKVWCYDFCFKPAENGGEEEWIPAYCFTETEFLPQDYEMMSWFTSTNPRYFFTSSVLCMKMLLDEEGENIVGDIALHNKAVRETVGGKRKIVVEELQTEQERVEKLKDIYGVLLTEEEVRSIPEKVRISAIGDKPEWT